MTGSFWVMARWVVTGIEDRFTPHIIEDGP